MNVHKLTIGISLCTACLAAFVTIAHSEPNTETKAPIEVEVEAPKRVETNLLPIQLKERGIHCPNIWDTVAAYNRTKAPISKDLPLPYEVQQTIVDCCDLYDLPVELVLGVIDVESDFHEDADNGTCYGLMQIHRGNANWVRKNADAENIFNVHDNIKAGCWILHTGIVNESTVERALIWYNAGRVYANSTKYSRSVLEAAEYWSQVINSST